MAKLDFKGLDELAKGLEERGKLELVKQIVKTNGAELNQKMVRNAVFVGGRTGKYTTGQTRRSIALTMHDGGLTAKVKPGTDYSPYVEHGTRFMSAQPFVGPAFKEQKEKFKRDLRDLT